MRKISQELAIETVSKDNTINISLDTIARNKQAIVFCASKRSAEKQAEDITKKSPLKSKELDALAESFRTVLSNPTKQCQRGAYCLKKGIAFHHAGLLAKQRELIEDAFRAGVVKVICSTPTLAAGLDMPAFRTILRDLKRFSGKWGMQYIPVLEYEQMAGRAGRPGKEDYGEAIAICNNEKDKEIILENYVYGTVEDIQSKLAVEPVLRTYVLSLVATEFVRTKQDLLEFFKKTFYAYQFGDMIRLEQIISRVIQLLKDYGFLESTGSSQSVDVLFSSADEVDDEQLIATLLGKRVSELYLDPYTANHLIEAMKKVKSVDGRSDNERSDSERMHITLGLLQAMSSTIEMEPLLRAKNSEIPSLQVVLAEWEEHLLVTIPSDYDYDFTDFLNSIKTSLFFKAWIDETDEEKILESFNIRPGETRAKLENLDWILRCTLEIAKFIGKKELVGVLARLQTRLKYGVKEELLPLLRLKGVGRVRARLLFNKGYKTLGHFSEDKQEELKQLLGEKVTENIFNQLNLKIKSNNLTDFM